MKNNSSVSIDTLKFLPFGCTPFDFCFFVKQKISEERHPALAGGDLLIYNFAMVGNKGIVIERVFDAPREAVWKAWTDEELAKKWRGPNGFTAPSIKIDLRVGGKYVFCMHGPKGSEWDRDMYSAGVYKEIVPPDPSNPSGQGKLVVTDYFSDEEGNMVEPSAEGQDSNFPKESTVTVLFEELDGGPSTTLRTSKTKLSIIYPRPESDVQFEAMKKSGMEEGWRQSLEKLALALQ